MDLIKRFFERGIEPDPITIFYIIILIFFLSFCFFHFLPEEKLLKIYSRDKGFKFKMDYDDWTEALRRQKVFYLVGIIYSLIILFLSKIYGKTVANIGIWILAPILILLSIWIGPVKKSKKGDFK